MTAQQNISRFLIITICSVIVIGCQPKSKSLPSETAQTEKSQAGDSERLDLLDLSSDLQVIPLENPKSGPITGVNVLIDVEPVQKDSVYQLIADIPDEIDSLNSQAYRVQIFSSKKFGESRHAKMVAEEIFDRPVFLDYEVPYYKIRVGNFASREKAEEYQQRVKSSGYKNAWIVVVIVNIKETTPMYDDLLLPEILDSLYLFQDEIEQNDESEDNE